MCDYNFQDTTEAAYPSEIRYEDPFVYRPMPKCEVEFEMVDGVYKVVPKGKNSIPELATPGTATEFFSDVQHICKVAARGPVKTFCYQRLMLLEQKYNLHVMMNAEKEFYCQKLAPHRDFYNVRKVSRSESVYLGTFATSDCGWNSVFQTLVICTHNALGYS